MTMRMPAGGFDIHFHIAGNRRFIAKLDHCAAKIRAAFAVQKTRMKNSRGSAVQCS